MNKGFRYLNDIFIVVYYFSKLNVLFLIYSLLGLGIFGFFPSLTSLFIIVKDRDYNESNYSIRKVYPIYFKKRFLKSNLIGWMMTGIGLLLYLNFNLLINNDYSFEPFIVVTFITVTSLFLTMLVWVFPLIISMEESLFDILRKAFIVGVLKLHLSIVVIIAAYFIFNISLLYPALLMFFSMSIFTYLWSLVTSVKVNVS